jgi:Holliday junction resolvase RusA-like endonuclease
MEHSKGSAKWKFIAMNAYTKNIETSQRNELMLHVKLLEKQEQAKLKTSGSIKIKVESMKSRSKNQWKYSFFSQEIHNIKKTLENPTNRRENI